MAQGSYQRSMKEMVIVKEPLGARQVLRSNELRNAKHQPKNPYKIQIFSNNKEKVLIWGKTSVVDKHTHLQCCVQIT